MYELRDAFVRFSVLSIVLVVGMAGSTHAGVIIVDPDDFSPGMEISSSFPGVTLSLLDGPGTSGQPPVGLAIYSRFSEIAATGSNIFAFATIDGDLRPIFVHNLEDLKVDFADVVNFVAVDFITDDSSDPARLEAYDVFGNLLEAVETPGVVGFGEVETAFINRPQGDIAYVIAGGIRSQGVYIDNLQYSSVPELESLVVWVLGAACTFGWLRYRRVFHSSPAPGS